jgi:hypothetical protein
MHVKIYDPRDSNAGQGDSNTLVDRFVRDRISLVAKAASKQVTWAWDFHESLLVMLAADCICMHVNWLKRRTEVRNEIEKRTGAQSLVPEEYFGVFRHDPVQIGQLIQTAKDVGEYEHWVFAGYREEVSDKVRGMNFVHEFEIDDFVDNAEMFDYISYFNLDYSEWWILHNDSNAWDSIIKFVENYNFTKK